MRTYVCCDDSIKYSTKCLGKSLAHKYLISAGKDNNKSNFPWVGSNPIPMVPRYDIFRLFFFFFVMAIPIAYGISPGQGSNQICSCDLYHRCSNARSFSHCATAETPRLSSDCGISFLYGVRARPQGEGLSTDNTVVKDLQAWGSGEGSRFS